MIKSFLHWHPYILVFNDISLIDLKSKIWQIQKTSIGSMLIKHMSLKLQDLNNLLKNQTNHKFLESQRKIWLSSFKRKTCRFLIIKVNADLRWIFSENVDTHKDCANCLIPIQKQELLEMLRISPEDKTFLESMRLSSQPLTLSWIWLQDSLKMIMLSFWFGEQLHILLYLPLEKTQQLSLNLWQFIVDSCLLVSSQVYAIGLSKNSSWTLNWQSMNKRSLFTEDSMALFNRFQLKILLLEISLTFNKVTEFQLIVFLLRRWIFLLIKVCIDHLMFVLRKNSQFIMVRRTLKTTILQIQIHFYLLSQKWWLVKVKQLCVQ